MFISQHPWIFKQIHRFSILGGVPIGIQHLLDSPGHGVAKVLEVVTAEVVGSEQHDLAQVRQGQMSFLLILSFIKFQQFSIGLMSGLQYCQASQ